MFDIFVVNKEMPGAVSLVEKLAENKGAGSIIFVTDEEMNCLQKGGVERLTSFERRAGDISLFEVKEGAQYIIVIKEFHVNIDDLAKLEAKGIRSTIIRTR